MLELYATGWAAPRDAGPEVGRPTPRSSLGFYPLQGTPRSTPGVYTQGAPEGVPEGVTVGQASLRDPLRESLRDPLRDAKRDAKHDAGRDALGVQECLELPADRGAAWRSSAVHFGWESGGRE